MFEYIDKIKLLIDKLASEQQEQLIKAAQMVADVIKNHGIVHTFGTGHSQMIGMELFGRASNIANVNAIMDDLVLLGSGARRSAAVEQISGLSDILWDKYKIETKDLFIIISNSGRNAMPLEMAIKAQEEGLKVIAITSKDQTMRYNSRHKSGKKLYQLADLVIDNCVPSGDGVIKMDTDLIGPASSILGLMIVNIISTEAIKINVQRGIKSDVFKSQNVDEQENDVIYKKYESRIKHL